VSEDEPLRVVLQREAELAPVRLSFRDWPGYGSPILHLAQADISGRIDDLARALAPRHRVLSLDLPRACAVEVSASHVAEFIEQFGFKDIVLLSEGATVAIAELAARWCSNRVAGVLDIHDDVSIEAVTSFVEAQCRPSR
jgi:hypothetical protein